MNKIQTTILAFCTILFLSLIFTEQAFSQKKGDFGLGIILGEPSGLSGKVWNSETRAIDFGVAWTTGNNGRLHFHSDYLIHRFDLIDVESGELAVYYGLGGRLAIGGDADERLGLRIPVGLAYFFPRDPFELFFEVVPVLDLLPGTDFNANGGFGVRYYLGQAR